MNLTRARTGDGTFGTLLDGNGGNFGLPHTVVTVERLPTGDHPCIPVGTYPWVKFDSPHNGPCLLLTVPGRSMIELHSANFYTELLGCIAPGSAFAQFAGVGLEGVINSKATLATILAAVGDSGTITITEDYA